MEIIDLEMIPGGPKKTCHASQFDNGRVIRFNLKENGQPFALSGTETVQAIIRKPDGSETTLDIANTSSTYVDLITEADTCDLAGVNHCEMKVTEDGEDLGSGNFDMKVEEDAYGAGDVTVGEASGAIASFETDIKDDLIECVCEINPVQDLHGYDHPWPAGGGKNKFDKTAVSHGYLINGAGNYVSYPDNNVSDYTPVEEGVGYYLYGLTKHPNTNQDNFELFDGSKTKVGYANVKTWEYPYTIPSGVKFVRYTVHDDDLNTAMFATSEGDYEPYENICPISGYTEANITRCGVNLFDKTSMDTTNGFVANAYLRNKNTVISDNDCNISEYISIGENVTITINPLMFSNPSLCFYDRAKNFISGEAYNGRSVVTITTPNNCAFIRFTIIKANIDTTQLELGSTSTSFESYKGDTATIEFGQTVYGGVLDVTRGKLTVTHLLNTYLGSADENWQKAGSVGNSQRFYIENQGEIKSINSANSNYLTPVDTFDHAFGTFRFATNQILIVHDNAGDFSDVASFKAYLASHNLQIRYEIATPFDIDLTPHQIEALLGVNNVWHDGNGDTEVKYLFDA